MKNPNQDPADGRTKRWWTALGGTVVFVVLGLVLAPGLTRRQPASVPERDSFAARSERPARIDETKGEPARIQSPSEVAPQPSDASPEPHTFDCMVEPSEVIEIRSPITGLIEAILVERSDYVEAGQVLARLESTVEQAAVRVAQARAERTVDVESSKVSLRLGKKRLARARELFEGESLSLDLREEVETEATLAALKLAQAREDHRLASLQLEQARAILERRTIRSPIPGFVVERLMAPGEVVDEETILRIAQVDPLRVQVILPSHWFARVRSGDRAEVIPEAPLDQVRAAEVSIVDQVMDGASGTFGVRLLLPNPDRDLPGGLRCQVRFLGDG